MKTKALTLVLALFTMAFCSYGCSKGGGDNGGGGGDKPTIKTTAVRGIWIPDPKHTTALTSYANVQKTVNTLSDLKFNAIFVCVYARTQTAYKSDVLMANSNYTSVDQSYMFAPYSYASSTNDPLKDLITLAHAKNIKVFFWYEYGFMAANTTAATVSNNAILAKHPTWNAINNSGVAASYNNSDFYFNSYNPEVQKFLTDLIVEGINKYSPDGVQCDDRAPAAPRNSGYDAYTSARFKAEKSSTPPANFEDPEWVSWRLDILNKYAKDLYTAVKAAKSDCIMSFSPNPYPWCEKNLMQAWPTWMKNGAVDMLNVQCYRWDAASYTATVNEVASYVRQSGSTKTVVAPGIILKNGDKYPDANVLTSQINQNRNTGFKGEVFFYNEGLNNETVKNVIKTAYAKEVSFPEIK